MGREAEEFDLLAGSSGGAGMEFEDDAFDTEWDFAEEAEESDSEDVEEASESEASFGFGDGASDSDEDLEDGADEYGSEVDLSSIGGGDASEKNEKKEYSVVTTEDDFIDDDGNVVVMDNDNPEDADRFEVKQIPIEKIAIATERIRHNSSFESLYKSIKSTGLLEPITVAPTKTEGYYVLLHGFRRLQACAKCGMKSVTCTINHRVKTAEIPVLEALYNHHQQYKMKDIVAYIEYLEKEKNIMNASLVEYLLQLNNGEYNKLKDVKEDGDPDIYGKLLNDELSIAQAFKNLENRRKKESKEEQQNKAAEKVYSEEESQIQDIQGSGETVDSDAVELTDDEIKAITIDPTTLDDNIEEESLDEMVEEGKQMEGFEDHKQDWRDRERIDPAIRKAVMSRDNNTCQCCKRGGPDYVDILDLHHIVEVYLGGVDSVENGLALCLNCHKQVHLYARNQLHIPKTKTTDELETEAKQEIVAENAKREAAGQDKLSSEEENDLIEHHLAIYKEEQNKYKRIVKLGNIIRKGVQAKGMKLEDFKKQHPIDKLGRQKPGQKNEIA